MTLPVNNTSSTNRKHAKLRVTMEMSVFVVDSDIGKEVGGGQTAEWLEDPPTSVLKRSDQLAGHLEIRRPVR